MTYKYAITKSYLKKTGFSLLYDQNILNLPLYYIFHLCAILELLHVTRL